MNGLGQLAERFGLVARRASARELDILVHGTTTADNTMIEMNGARDRPARHRGPPRRDRAAAVPQGRDLGPELPGPDRRSPAAGPASRSPSAWTSRATCCSPLDEDAVRRGVQRLQDSSACASIAVMYLFSFVNPEHERRTREIVLEEFPDVEHISLSHEVMPRGPEFERVSTTLVNAYVAPRIAHYTGHLQDELRARRLRRPAADHAVDRRRHAARLRRPPRGHAARDRARPAA